MKSIIPVCLALCFLALAACTPGASIPAGPMQNVSIITGMRGPNGYEHVDGASCLVMQNGRVIARVMTPAEMPVRKSLHALRVSCRAGQWAGAWNFSAYASNMGFAMAQGNTHLAGYNDREFAYLEPVIDLQFQPGNDYPPFLPDRTFPDGADLFHP